MGVTLGIWRKGLQGPHPPPANPSILTVPTLGVAILGSGLDLWVVASVLGWESEVWGLGLAVPLTSCVT